MARADSGDDDSDQRRRPRTASRVQAEKKDAQQWPAQQRQGEGDQVVSAFRDHFGVPLVHVDARGDLRGRSPCLG